MQNINPSKKCQQPEPEIDEYLLTQKEHKKWYNRGLMGNLGDKRGFLAEEKGKKPRQK